MINYLYENFYDPEADCLNGDLIWNRCAKLVNEGNMTRSTGTGEMDGLVLFTYSREYQFGNFAKQWDPFVEHTRGVVFDTKTEFIEVVALGLIKLFNYGEGEIHYPSPGATVVGCVEKVDGSLGMLFHHNGVWKLTTRGGLNGDIALYGKKILDRQTNGDYTCFDPRYTYLFEIVYPDNQIVVDYKGKEELVYIARRHNRTGELIYHHNDKGIVLPKDVRTVRTFPPLKTIEEIRLMINQEKGLDQEGSVTHFSDGSAFKVKGEDYLRIHRAKAHLTFNRVLESIRDWKALDYKKSLEEELWPDFDRIHDDIMRQCAQHMANIQTYYRIAMDSIGLGDLNRKTFALAVQQTDLIPQEYKRFMFLRLDNKVTVAHIIQMLDIKPTKHPAYANE